ncbi:hypothetical protein EDB81DRAFT_881251 [Dactylonectria macrodidyma]|uniref:RBR-type E3 ubiquitin transferase n=1 Tax=Dactylonectria macrodidyma TaxID=307937 RepID=A0A9P9FAG1_9HYPO|nr:hypothetical protein EDB81DRAFT_881251 [Dactylonectria macrodidyma]
MFRNFKKRAITVFRKTKAPATTTDHPPDYDSIATLDTSSTTERTTSTAYTSTRDQTVVPPAPPPPSPPVYQRRPSPPAEVLPVSTTNARGSDTSFSRDVPNPNSSPPSNSMVTNGGYYGRINPDIMSGFGGDDDSLWLVDDEETDEEDRRQEDGDGEVPRETLTDTRSQRNSDTQAETASHRSQRSQQSQRSHRSSREDMPIDQAPPQVIQEQAPSAPSPESAPPSFRYSVPTLLDDDEFASLSTTTPETPPLEPTPARRRGYAPISAAILNLTNMDVDDLEEPPTEAPKPRDEAVHHHTTPPASSSSHVNPYVALLEQRDDAMTVAYLRRLDQPDDEVADDFRFGQRYQKAPDTPDVIVTRRRVPATAVVGDLDCVVCTETKATGSFPRFSITGSCTHPPTTCLECIQLSIESDLSSKLWTEIRCPECRELLEYADIQRFANKQTFVRYETLALRAAMSEADNFIWCTSSCGSGQIHESGEDQPIVTCLHCSHRSCFHHNVPWHENLSCEEYDKLLADPENFRSRLELDNEAWSESQRAQLEADRAIAQNMLADEQAEMQRREERARQEREQARKAAALVRKIAARRKLEEQQSEATVSSTTKPCPGCGWAIEKNDGCSHMTCPSCQYQFCYECGANHRKIMAGDNTAHKESCKFHPDNMEEEWN